MQRAPTTAKVVGSALGCASLVLALPAVARAQEEAGGHGGAADEALDGLEMLTGLSHAATLASTTFLAGVVAFAVLVWLPICRGVVPGVEAARPFVPLAWSLFALLALAGVVETSLYAVEASGQSFSLPLLWQALSETRVGSVWLARLGFALAAAAAVTFAAGAYEGSPYWWAALGLACVPLLTLTQLSHAAAEGGAVLFLADLTHAAAAAAWMGGILAFPTLLLGPLRKAPTETRSELLDRSIPRFSRVATLAVAVLAATGFYAGLQHVPDLTALLGTNYGRALILKTFLVLMMLAIGALNLVDRNRNDSFDTMVGFELAFAAAVFVATGFLTTLTPADAGMP